MQKRTTIFSAAAVLSLSSLLGTASGAMAASPHRAAIANGGTVVQAIPTAFGTNMIPQLDSSLYTAQATSYQFDSILQVNTKDQLIGDLVDKWWYSPDKKTVFFRIDKRARWSNGQPVTPKDVELDVDWLASKTYNVTDGGAYGYLVQGIVGAANPVKDGTTPSGFKIINASEFSLSMPKPDAAVLLSQWASIQPLPSFSLGKLPMSAWKASTFNKVPDVGTGPFIMTSVVAGQSITQRANPYYLFGKPHLAYNIWKVVSPDVVAGDLASGQVDLSGIHAKDVAKMKQFANIGVAAFPANAFSFLGWRLNNTTYGKEFSMVKFRQAVEYAINRQALIKAIDKGYGIVENGPLPPINFWYNKQLDGAYAYSPAKANQLLDQAGFKIVNGWRTTPDGKPFNPTLTLSSGDTNIQIMATFIQQFLRAVHINLELLPPINFNTLWSDLSHDANGEQSIQSFIMGWNLSDDPDPRGLWRSTDALNLQTIDWSNAKDPALKQNDQLIAKQASAAAFAVAYRAGVIHQWQKLMIEQMPENFLTDDDTIYAYNKNLHGVVFSPYGEGGTMFPYKWYLSK